MASNDQQEPTLELDDNELSLNDEEPTMHIEEEAAEAQEESFGLSDAEVGHEEGAEEETYEEAPLPMVAGEAAEIPSAGSFNALLVVSLVAYIGALAVLLYRLAQYSAPGTFPWGHH